jgi:hypothetical protein
MRICLQFIVKKEFIATISELFYRNDLLFRFSADEYSL